MLDALLLADLVLESRYFMRVQKGFLITNPSEIFRAFKKDRWLPLELLAALPLDLLALFIGVRYLSLLRIFKLARLKHLLTYSERAQAALMRHSVNAPNVRQFVTLYLALAITCHWVGCMWLLAADVGVALGTSHLLSMIILLNVLLACVSLMKYARTHVHTYML
jgi:hypothetical protein